MDKFRTFIDFYKCVFEQDTYQKVVDLSDNYIKQTDDTIEQDLIRSLLDPNNYIKKIDPDKFYIYVDLLATLVTYADILNICNELKNRTSDVAQINTLNRILKRNVNKINIPTPEYNIKIYKPCPHCKRVYTGNKNTKYVICGYSLKGFDWKGCGYDWCFACGKKLCKCWHINQLFNINNRSHNSKCCKGHATRSKSVYPDEYCMCPEQYNQRNK